MSEARTGLFGHLIEYFVHSDARMPWNWPIKLVGIVFYLVMVVIMVPLDQYRKQRGYFDSQEDATRSDC